MRVKWLLLAWIEQRMSFKFHSIAEFELRQQTEYRMQFESEYTLKFAGLFFYPNC